VLRKRRKNRVFVISFFIVFFGLFGIAGFLYYSSLSIPVYHIPESLPTYNAPWMRYVPANILQITYRNLTSLRTYNGSALNSVPLFELASPHLTIYSDSIDTLMTIVFSRPNSTVEIAFLKKSDASRIFSSFSKTVVSSVQGDARLYYTQVISNKTLVKGWVMLLQNDSLFAFSEGSRDAYMSLQLVLQSRNGTIYNFGRDLILRKMLYIVGGASGHLALTFQNFPGLVRTGNETLQVVDSDGFSVKTYYVVGFSNGDYAMSQLDYFKREYFTSQRFSVYDNFLVAIKTEPMSELVAAFRAVG
jgi:hypothetical protein